MLPDDRDPRDREHDLYTPFGLGELLSIKLGHAEHCSKKPFRSEAVVNLLIYKSSQYRSCSGNSRQLVSQCLNQGSQ